MKSFNIVSLGTVGLGVLLVVAGCETSRDEVKYSSPSGNKHAMDAALTAVTASGPVRASKLFGTDVKDVAGKKVGDLKDLVADDGNRVVAVVKRSSDGAVIGLPLNELTPMASPRSTSKPDTTPRIEEFVAKPNVDKIMTAPVLNDMKTVDGAWVGKVCDHFGMKSSTSDAGAATDGNQREPSPPLPGTMVPSTAGQSMVPPPIVADSSPMPGHALCADKLMGKSIKNGKGEDIGKVEDFAIDVVNAKVAYVIVGTGGVMGVGTKYHGVPLRSFTVDAQSRNVTLPLDKATLEKSPGFELDHLPMAPDVTSAVSAVVPATVPAAPPATAQPSQNR